MKNNETATATAPAANNRATLRMNPRCKHDPANPKPSSGPALYQFINLARPEKWPRLTNLPLYLYPHRADEELVHPQVSDRRRGYRQKASALAVLRPTDGVGRPLDAHVFELSMYGVGLSVREALEVGATFDFELSDGRQSGNRIQVRSCRVRADNMFDVGAQFC